MNVYAPLRFSNSKVEKELQELKRLCSSSSSTFYIGEDDSDRDDKKKRRRTPLDESEPRLEQELTAADNVMAVGAAIAACGETVRRAI
jgi:hypothetical protein